MLRAILVLSLVMTGTIKADIEHIKQGLTDPRQSPIRPAPEKLPELPSIKTKLKYSRYEKPGQEKKTERDVEFKKISCTLDKNGSLVLKLGGTVGKELLEITLKKFDEKKHHVTSMEKGVELEVKPIAAQGEVQLTNVTLEGNALNLKLSLKAIPGSEKAPYPFFEDAEGELNCPLVKSER